MIQGARIANLASVKIRIKMAAYCANQVVEVKSIAKAICVMQREKKATLMLGRREDETQTIFACAGHHSAPLEHNRMNSLQELSSKIW